MICSYCGQEDDGDAAFCRACGARLVRPQRGSLPEVAEGELSESLPLSRVEQPDTQPTAVNLRSAASLVRPPEQEPGQWYGRLRDLHYSLIRQYNHILSEADQLGWFAAQQLLGKSNEGALRSVFNSSMTSGLFGFRWRFWLYVFGLQNRSLIPGMVQEQEHRSPLEDGVYTWKERFENFAWDRPIAIGKRAILLSGASGSSAARGYLGISRLLVFGPLVRSHVRYRVKRVLRRLRESYLAERVAVNPSSETSPSDRFLLSRMAADVTDFLVSQSAFSNTSTRGAQITGIFGGIFKIGVPTGLIYSFKTFGSGVWGPYYDTFRAIVNWEIDPSKIDPQIVIVSIGGAAGVLIAVLGILSVFVLAQVMAFFASQILFFKNNDNTSNLAANDETSETAVALEEQIFGHLRRQLPRHKFKPDTRYVLAYLGIGPAVGVLMLVLLKLIPG